MASQESNPWHNDKDWSCHTHSLAQSALRVVVLKQEWWNEWGRGNACMSGFYFNSAACKKNIQYVKVKNVQYVKSGGMTFLCVPTPTTPLSALHRLSKCNNEELKQTWFSEELQAELDWFSWWHSHEGNMNYIKWQLLKLFSLLHTSISFCKQTRSKCQWSWLLPLWTPTPKSNLQHTT